MEGFFIFRSNILGYLINKYMSQLVTRYSQLRDRIKIGSISIPHEDYPFAAYCIGYLSAKTSLSIELLFELLEAISELNRSKVFSLIIVKQVLQIIEDFPEEAEKIMVVLKSISNGNHLDVIEWLQSFYQDEPRALSRNQQTQQLQPLPPVPPEIQNDGTMELDDILDINFGNNESLQYEKEKKRLEDLDIEFARKMQEEFNQQKQRVGEDEDAPCEICYVNLFEDDVETLDCGHLFHKNCLVESFKNNIINNTFPIRCPNDDCKKEATEGDLRVILSKEMFDKYQSHTLKAYADEHGDSISWCPTANCGYMFFFEKSDEQRFECLECHKDYCLNCRVEWHKDMTCKEYKISNTTSEDDEKFISFVKGKKFKQCPKCKFWVQKNEGCDHMTCKCKFEFCYKCGGVYMKCQCAENARIQMENRRRVQQERNRRKLERKGQLAAKRNVRDEKKRALQRQREERRKIDEQKSNRRSKRKR